jgi:anthranilate phosphoribosyltransferase
VNSFSGNPTTDITALNAAALLLTAGKASSLRDGFGQAREALLSGEAGKVLSTYVEASHG